MSASTVPVMANSVVSSQRKIASEFKSRWRAGEPPDARAVLDQHENDGWHKSVLLDLVYEEYCLRCEAGESINVAEFSRRFPTIGHSLIRQLAIHQYLSERGAFTLPHEVEAWPAAGQEFAGFTLIEELGRGAFGRVFLGSERTLRDRPVVVKVTPHGSREAEALAQVPHPNIVPVYSVQQDELTGLTAICMPFVSRATLLDVMDLAFAGETPPAAARVIVDSVTTINAVDGAATSMRSADRMSPKGAYVDAVIRIGIQLAEALAAVHAKGIYHRDIKPSNVLMDLQETPMLIDFSLFQEHGTAAPSGGTLPYMSPEQLVSFSPFGPSQHNSQVDARSDLFSLAVTLYELLSGSLPFGPIPPDMTRDRLPNYLLDQQKSGPRPLTELNNQVDPSLAAVFEDCLAFDPADRPNSADEVAARLRAAMSPTHRIRRTTRAHPWRTAVTAASLAAICVAFAIWWINRPPYLVREFTRARQAIQEKKYDEAIDSLNNVLRKAPNHIDALIARGKSYMALHQFDSALESFERAAKTKLPRDIRLQTEAYQGYCLLRLDHFRDAILRYKNAERGGLKTAALYNNLGFARLMNSHLEEAESNLVLAIDLEPNLQAARYNRAITLFRLSLKPGKSLPEEAIRDIEHAIRIGPKTGGLYRDAALLWSHRHRESRQQIQDYLERAIEMGIDPRNISKDPSFIPFLDGVDLKRRKDRALTAESSRSFQDIRISDPF